jgi:plasmid maintenance system antidote protein VapI
VQIGAFFDTDPQSWLNLQTRYDTEMAKSGSARGSSKRSGSARPRA